MNHPALRRPAALADEYAGRPQTQAPGTQEPAASATPSDCCDHTTAPPAASYTDGTYTASESYGPVDDLVEEDSIDVTVTLSGGVITDMNVTGHPLTSVSRDYMKGFVAQIEGAVTGRSLADAHVPALAGASKTSKAFNRGPTPLTGRRPPRAGRGSTFPEMRRALADAPARGAPGAHPACWPLRSKRGRAGGAPAASGQVGGVVGPGDRLRAPAAGGAPPPGPGCRRPGPCSGAGAAACP